jgi:hypothetical protein
MEQTGVTIPVEYEYVGDHHGDYGGGSGDPNAPVYIAKYGKPVPRYTKVCTPYYPAIPPTPGVPPTPGILVVSNNIGWNSGGRSIAEVADLGGFSFSVYASSVGVVVGLNNYDHGYGYAEMPHALYFSHGAVQVYESGVFVANAGSFISSDVFSIVRQASTVEYFKNGVTLWTSPRNIEGSMFLDSSLYFAGDTIVDAGPASDALSSPTLASSYNTSQPSVAEGYAGYYNYAHVQSLQAIASAGTGGCSVNYSLPSAGQGFQGTYAQATASSLPAYATAGLSGHCVCSALPATTEAYAGKYAISINHSAPSVSESTAGMIQPSWATASNISVQSVSYSHGLTGEIGGQTTAKSRPDYARASNFATGYSDAVSAPSEAISGGYVVISIADATLPALTGSASGTLQPAEGAAVVLPALGVSAYSGAQSELTLPMITPVVTGTVPSIARVDVTLPALLGASSGTVGGIAFVSGMLPAVTGASYGGGQAAGTLPALTGYGVGTIGGIAEASGLLPALVATAEIVSEAFARVDVTLPALTAAPSGQAWITLPALTAHALGSDVVAVTYEAYAINLTTGAVSHYTNYPFDNILRFGSKYYGVKADGVFEIGGSLDLTVPIDAHIKTFQTDFGVKNYKRLPYVYASGRSDGGVTIGVTPDEGVTYEYDSYWGEVPGTANHRATVGKAIRGVYYSLDISNIDGSSLELDEISAEVAPTQRAL